MVPEWPFKGEGRAKGNEEASHPVIWRESKLGSGNSKDNAYFTFIKTSH